ncbi:hypothetical protein N7447_004973 [Penicillium robsamsonii]|uniref:uncharacterized protein n=1 Tax=Penicillium robsamsonii TaxID=1792511 RepID=UPI002548E7DF|nr:uncharacterized protein N7447_004973 [Penicillium robsamsonii]KAJ5822633.1 hypothetical protein N7447_004973 [Penicillium robsamsonii]
MTTMEHHQNKRKRTTLACDACRARRTKCDSQKPSCRYCQTHGLDCLYQDAPAEPPSRVEVELNAMNKRLDQLISLMLPAEPISLDSCAGDPPTEYHVSADQENSPFDLPSKLLGNPSVMHALGLDANFAQVLTRGERVTGPESHANAGTRMLIVHHRHAVSALASFSARVHTWYPILPSGFSEEYLRVLSGPLHPSSESCLSLLVAAVGHVVEEDETVLDTPYLETALASLPIIIADGMEGDDSTAVEQSRRAYWGALLLENEIGGQLDVANSGIWCLDEHVPLPLCHQTWQFTPESTSPTIAAPDSPDFAPSTNPRVQNMRSYFLTEIAMRRMLHRCNTAVQVTSAGKYIYAPGIALELERQLEEWYHYIPEMDRFGKGDVSQPLESVDIPSCPLSNFLRVQYYCCKLSIYWPAVYQAMQDGAATNLLLDHCQRFFDSYVMLIPSIVAAFRDCRVNRWTLFVRWV